MESLKEELQGEVDEVGEYLDALETTKDAEAGKQARSVK